MHRHLLLCIWTVETKIKNLACITSDMSFSHNHFISFLQQINNNILAKKQGASAAVAACSLQKYHLNHLLPSHSAPRCVKTSSLKIPWKILPAQAESTGLSLPGLQGRYHLEPCFGGSTVLRKQKREFWCPSNSSQIKSPCFRHTAVKGVNRKMRQTIV